jgi:D-hexose-6-phosphate mutarotase
MNKIEMKNNGWQLEIDLNGGRIVNLGKDGQKILGTFERIDGKSGNTHICLPNFAAEGIEKFGFIFHGPFRNSEWKLMNQTESSLEINCEIDGLNVDQKFVIGEKFEQEIKVKNMSNDSKRVNIAVHNYWDTEFGWEGSKLDGMNLKKGIEDSIDLQVGEKNVLEIPNKKTINWELDGFKYVKLWTGFKEENGEKIFDQKYICVEPTMEREGFVETDESFFDPGEEMTLRQRIF